MFRFLQIKRENIVVMKNLLLMLILFISSVFINAQQNVWTDVSEAQITQVGERYIIPDHYRTLRLNLGEVKSILQSAPMEFTADVLEEKTIILLPMPDGTFQKFKFWESPTMSPELQTKYPEIRTYTGQGIDDPYATLKLDLTPLGFHAQILSPNGSVFIDPYTLKDFNNYLSYYTKDFHKDDGFVCEVGQSDLLPETDYTIETPTGPQLRTYRLAVAATGEYTAFFGGTVTLGLAAVTTSVNRVNGVYEKEVAVRMVLIANNNLIIYTNSSTDPYTNGNGSTMLGQNQTNIDAVIGTANYDIGHVFSTGGGGIAGLGVVCRAGQKARGVTGSSSPVGDPYDIDYVAHEMGHQFGANHTFNSVTSNCGGGNRNASTAYEPGSGTTIMAYAGICGADDLQPHSDAYFHTISFDEIVAYTTTGLGNGCPVITNTGNGAPIVSVPTGGFTIPKSTPFALTGSATDPNNDVLTYCWEEFDLGPAGSPNSPSGNAPIFRSFTGVASPTRIFPKLSDILNNTQTIGEILPSYTRSLTFRLTVRDNKAGGGGVNYNTSTFSFNVDGNSGPFLVTSPNTNVSWTGNTQQTVTWNVASTSSSPVNCSNVKILLSTDGGNNFNTVILVSTPNDGSELITLPNLPTSQARIKVEAVGNIFFDISNSNFTIINNPGVSNPGSFNASSVSATQINLSFTPNGNNNNVVIVWNNTGTFTTPAGSPPSVGSSFAGGTLLYNGLSSPINHTGLTPSSDYFYKAFSYNGSNYSSGITANASTSVLTDFTVGLNVSDNCTNSSHLIFGTAPGATNCFDPGLDESAPPLPPTGAFDGRFISCSEGLFTDIRGTNYNSERVWDLYYQPAENCSPITLDWDPAFLPDSGYFHLLDPFLGTLVNVNMRSANNFTDIAGYGHLQIKYNYNFCTKFTINASWNMLSLPVGVIDANYLTLFPNAVHGTLYGYSDGYFSTETVATASGYWLKFPGAEFAEVCGEDITEAAINLNAGWNIIGGPNCNVPLEDVMDPGNIIVPGSLYGYSGGYVNSNSVDATKAYWIKAASAGTITISCGTLIAKKNSYLIIPSDVFSGFSKVTISDAGKNIQTLYFNGKLNENVNFESFSLPPLPPPGGFDARLKGNFRLTENDEAEIHIQASQYPLYVNIEGLNSREEFNLIELVNGVEIASHKIENGSKISITNPDVSILKIIKTEELPSAYYLEQNYPNPFNPNTTIEFSLPENTSNVRLSIYSTLGEKIIELVNTSLEAGMYQYQWNAGSAASGIYFYELKVKSTSGSFVSMKKMILLK